MFFCKKYLENSLCKCALARVLHKRAFEILSLTEIWKISIIEDMRQYAHAGIIIPLLLKGYDVSSSVGAIVYYSMMGIPEPLLDSIQ